MNLANPHTSDRPTRMQSRAEGDALALYAARLKIEEGVRQALHQAHMVLIEELELLDDEIVMSALRKQLSGPALHEAISEGFYAARQMLWKVSGVDFPEPKMEVEDV